MPGLYTVPTRAPGTIITALIYNGDHQLHVNGRTATLVGSYSATAGQMQLQTNPLPGGIESLPGSMAAELERMRFEIGLLKQYINGNIAPTHWYDPIKRPGFATIAARIQRTAAFSIPNNALTTINFVGGSGQNTNSIWNQFANQSRFTAPFTGKYIAGCGVLWDAGGAAGTRQISLGVNGSFASHGSHAIVSNTSGGVDQIQYQAFVEHLALTAADYVEFAAFQNSGVAINLLGTSSGLPIDVTQQSIVGFLVMLGS